MKKLVFVLGAVLFFATLMGCSKKSESTSEDSDSDEWPAMDSFHMLMADAFHPFKDSANVEPARKLAGDLAKEADAWQAAPLPEKVNTDDMKAMLESLKTQSHQLADQIQAGATNEEIGASLTALHDSFHKITEAWHGGSEKHEH